MPYLEFHLFAELVEAVIGQELEAGEEVGVRPGPGNSHEDGALLGPGVSGVVEVLLLVETDDLLEGQQ